MAKNAVQSTPDAPKRRRRRKMSDAEVITILICFHFNSYRYFKHYYLACVCGFWKDLFPKRFSYNRFIEVMPRCFVALTMFLSLSCFGECTGISFVDSTCIPVIHNKRLYGMKVFKGFAVKGKSTMGGGMWGSNCTCCATRKARLSTSCSPAPMSMTATTRSLTRSQTECSVNCTPTKATYHSRFSDGFGVRGYMW